jgi:hypothetical protein
VTLFRALTEAEARFASVQDWNHNRKTYFISHGAYIELTGNKAPQAVVKTGHKISHPFEAINLGLKLLRCIFMCSKNNYTVPITSTVNLTTNWTKNNRGANFLGPQSHCPLYCVRPLYTVGEDSSRWVINNDHQRA